ncbi:MAG: hypothetical protein ACK5U7_10095 [Bacteroidota bacterium]
MGKYRIIDVSLSYSYMGNPHPSVVAAWRDIVEGLRLNGRVVEVTQQHIDDADGDDDSAELQAVADMAEDEARAEYVAKFPASDCSMMVVEVAHLESTPA